MRLACENCAAVFVIDDGAMTARGVRAQCPGCKHIQYIAPPVDPSAQPDPAARAQEMARPISVSRPPVRGREPDPEPNGKSQVARMTLATRMVARPPAPPPEALTTEGAAARAELFGELEWSDSEPHDPGGPPVPASAVPVAAADTARAVSHVPGGPVASLAPEATVAPASPASLPPTGAPSVSRGEGAFTLEERFPPADTAEAPGGPPSLAPPVEGCASCGHPLLEVEDVASGVCTPCRDAAAARLAPAPFTAPPPPPAVDAEPSTLRSTTPPPRRTPPTPRLGPVPSPPSAPARPGRLVLVALAGVVVLGAVAVFWLRARGGGPTLSSPVRQREPRVDPSAPLPTGLEQRIAAWRAADPGPRPTAAAALVEAEREIALDQPAAYASAERRLQAALVDAPRNPELLGAWLSAVALGRGSTLAPGEFPALLELGNSALVASGRFPAVLVGVAELLLARPGPGDDERARALAREALATAGPPSAKAGMVLARTYARTSAGLALAELHNAEQIDPSQRRIPLIRAEAYAADGDPRAALAALQSRLALEPDHADSLIATGSLLVDVGEPDQARRLFERLQSDPRTQDGPALFALAALKAQVQGRPRDAMQLLRAALKRDRLGPRARVQANVLLAAAARAAGDADASRTAARAALAIDPGDPGGHLALLLLALERGDGPASAVELAAVAGRLGDPGLEGVLEGRVRIAQGQPAAAAERFEQTQHLDPRRGDALLWAAAAYASVPNRAQALALGPAIAQADPGRTGPWTPLSPLAVRPEELLRGAEGRLQRLSQSDADAMPLIGEAVLRFQRRDLAAAEALLDRVLRADSSQPLALAWRALVLLERGDAKGALATAALAQQAGRALPMVQYAAGVTALAAGDLDAAWRSLREVVQVAPGLLAAQVKLAEVEAKLGAIPAARERLRKVVQIDPSYASAKRALYLLPKES